MKFREINRDEIPDVWSIDRSEVIERLYIFRDGELVLEPEYFDMKGWPPGEAETYTPILLECFDRGGYFLGVFEAEALVGIMVLESKLIGSQKDTLQMKFLQISRRCRGQGLGSKLFHLAADRAREQGAQKMYISATPSENTINFYLNRGCRLTPEPDPELFALEPKDIHLEYALF